MFKRLIFFALILAFIFGLSSGPILAITVLPIEPTPSPPGFEPSDPGIEIGGVEQSSGSETYSPSDDLGVKSTSWLSRTWRNVRIFFTTNPVKKAELELEKANVELVRAVNVIQEEVDDEKLQEKLEKRTERFQQILNKVADRIEAYTENNPSDEEADKFLDKYTDQQIKHQEILEKIESQVIEPVADSIREQRELHLQKFGEVMESVQSREEFKERVRRVIEVRQSEGSEDEAGSGLEVINDLRQVSDGIKQSVEEFQNENRNMIRLIEIKASVPSGENSGNSEGSSSGNTGTVQTVNNIQPSTNSEGEGAGSPNEIIEADDIIQGGQGSGQGNSDLELQYQGNVQAEKND